MFFYGLGNTQSIDTLRNLSTESLLISTKYNSVGKWGYYTGHNYLGRQQFAEKYYVEGTVTVIGVIAQLSGSVSTQSIDSSAFTLWSVGSNRLPQNKLNATYTKNRDLNVTGNPFSKLFKSSTVVSDSFYVALDLLDYSHHSFKDTIGLLYGIHGSRENSDLDKFGRNAIQVHSHGAPVWRDFYSQNFTPIATHFALFPIILTASSATIIGVNSIPGVDTLVGSNTVSGNNTITSLVNISSKDKMLVYPVPASNWLIVEEINQNATIRIIDYMGKEYQTSFDIENNKAKVDITSLLTGKYILLISQGRGNFGLPFVKQ